MDFPVESYSFLLGSRAILHLSYRSRLRNSNYTMSQQSRPTISMGITYTEGSRRPKSVTKSLASARWRGSNPPENFNMAGIFFLKRIQQNLFPDQTDGFMLRYILLKYFCFQVCLWKQDIWTCVTICFGRLGNI